ncbi:MAG: S41 family peptidase [Prevotella sp.]|nr:S41 family peptidase [Prevotella sp.]
MKTVRLFTLLALLPLLFTACVDEDEYADSPEGNFEALWRIIDEHYCFFDYKANQYGLDWNEVHQRYARQIDASITEAQLFEVLGNMLSELRDGHVNMYSSWDVARNWSWHEDFPANFSDNLLDEYLGTDYRIAAGLRYRVLDDNIGYIRCASFANEFGAGNLDDILLYLAPCRALIIDVRDNAGGQITAAEQLAARFTNEERLVGYMQHKTGRGHSDFSKMEEQRLKPSKGIRWQKRVAVLTNRSVYSAANEFVKYMKQCPNVITVGDQTGGGAGLPFSSELPNGWGVRFSACPMYDVNRQPTEFGIQPDYRAELSQADMLRGYDTIIETARREI